MVLARSPCSGAPKGKIVFFERMQKMLNRRMSLQMETEIKYKFTDAPFFSTHLSRLSKVRLTNLKFYNHGQRTDSYFIGRLFAKTKAWGLLMP